MLTDFNNFCRAETGKMYKTGMHLLIYYKDVDQLRERLILLSIFYFIMAALCNRGHYIFAL